MNVSGSLAILDHELQEMGRGSTVEEEPKTKKAMKDKLRQVTDNRDELLKMLADVSDDLAATNQGYQELDADNSRLLRENRELKAKLQELQQGM